MLFVFVTVAPDETWTLLGRSFTNEEAVMHPKAARGPFLSCKVGIVVRDWGRRVVGSQQLTGPGLARETPTAALVR
jgi:hypothetical protein